MEKGNRNKEESVFCKPESCKNLTPKIEMNNKALSFCGSSLKKDSNKTIQFVEGFISTPIGNIPKVKTKLSKCDIISAFKVRLGIGRDNYAVASGLYAVGNPSEEITYFDRDSSWEIEIQNMVDCIQGDTPVEKSSSIDAYKVMNIVDKAYRDSGLIAMREC